jgi:hypothetical protein
MVLRLLSTSLVSSECSADLHLILTAPIDPSSALKFKGVVYNEMKGAMVRSQFLTTLARCVPLS